MHSHLSVPNRGLVPGCVDTKIYGYSSPSQKMTQYSWHSVCAVPKSAGMDCQCEDIFWQPHFCRLCEDAPESSAELPALGLLCKDRVLTFRSLSIFNFHTEMISYYQKQCRNSTKLLKIHFRHFSQMLMYCTFIVNMK